MRKLPLLLAALGASALVLAGCSASTPEPFAAGCDTLAVSDPSVTDLVTVTGEFGVAPKVTMYSPFVTEQTVHSVVEAGHGRVIDTPNQLVSLDMALYSGTTGAQLVTSVFGDANPAKPIALSSWGETFEGLQRGLMCATEGSRVIVAMPSDDVAGGQGVVDRLRVDAAAACELHRGTGQHRGLIGRLDIQHDVALQQNVPD